MKPSIKFIGALCVAGLTLWSSAVTQAALTPGITFTTSAYEDGGGYALGWDFTPSTALSVTELGFYDNGDDGLLFNHNVGIFRVSDQQLMASATVLTNDTHHVNQYWYHDIPTTTLDAGVTYRAVAVTVAGEGWAWNTYDGANLKPTPNPDITLGDSYFVGSNGNLLFPTSNNGKWFAAANFLIATIPEPNSALLVLGGLLLIRRKR